MKKIIVTGIAFITIWGCTKRMAPATTANRNEPAKTSVAVSSQEVLAAGETAYKAKCGRCHALPDVSKFTAEKWVSIMNWMAPKAKMGETEKANVLAYVQANARK